MPFSRISAVDTAVSPQTIRALRAEIIHTQRVDSGTYWYALEAPPRRLFEQVIQHLRTLVPRGNELVGAEWWFRATTTDTGFPFHFDRDEGVRSAIVSPDLASILYLSRAGGPTIVVDATPTRKAAPDTGIAVHPVAGRFAMFPGTFLHGVLPGRPGRWPRVTMLVNWWRSVPRLERARELRGCKPPGGWRIAGVKTPVVALESVDPSRLLARAAWRDLISKQATYR